MFKPGLVGLILLWGCHTLTEKQNLRYSNSFHFEKFFSRYSTLWLWLKKDPFLYREKNHLISGQKISSVPLRSPIISQVWPGGAGERWVEGKILTWRGHWKVWMFFFLKLLGNWDVSTTNLKLVSDCRFSEWINSIWVFFFLNLLGTITHIPSQPTPFEDDDFPFPVVFGDMWSFRWRYMSPNHMVQFTTNKMLCRNEDDFGWENCGFGRNS